MRASKAALGMRLQIEANLTSLLRMLLELCIGETFCALLGRAKNELIFTSLLSAPLPATRQTLLADLNCKRRQASNAANTTQTKQEWNGK